MQINLAIFFSIKLPLSLTHWDPFEEANVRGRSTYFLLYFLVGTTLRH